MDSQIWFIVRSEKREENKSFERYFWTRLLDDYWKPVVLNCCPEVLSSPAPNPMRLSKTPDLAFRFVVIVLFFLFFYYQVRADWQISGYVKDSSGMAIEQVLVKSNNDYCLTGERGEYRLSVTEQDTVLFHKLGFQDIILAVEDVPASLQLRGTVISISGKNVTAARNVDEGNIRKIIIDNSNKSQIGSIAGYIAAESGLQLSGTRTAGSSQTLQVPGYDSRHTLVMLDGIPLNNPGEEFDLTRIPIGLIAEIEILSSTGAMGTAINLITKAPEKNKGAKLQLSYGSFEHYAAEMNYNKTYKQVLAQFNLNYQQAENDFSFPAPESWQEEDEMLKRENNSFRQLDLSTALKYRTSSCDWDIKIYYTDFFRMLPGAINNPELYYKARMTGKLWKLQSSWQHQFHQFRFQTNLWYHAEKTIYDNTRLQEPYNNFLLYYIYGINRKKTYGIRPVLEWQADWVNFKIGAEYKSETYEYEETTNPANSISELKRNSPASFGVSMLHTKIADFEPWLKVNARYDDASDFSPETGGSIFTGITYENLFRWETSMGKIWGYTLPSFYSLYWQGDAEAMGNPDLVPETSKGWQLDTSIEYAGNSCSFTGRSDQLEDMIIWIQTFNKAWKPVNIGAAEVKNLEYRCDLHPYTNLQVKAVFTRTITADKTTLSSGEPSAYYNKELIYTPDYQGNVALNWTPPHFHLGLSMEFTGSQWTTRDQLSTQKRLSEYELYNCSVSWDMKYKSWLIKWQLLINNIFDNHYYIYEYMPQPGRNINFSIILKKG